MDLLVQEWETDGTADRSRVLDPDFRKQLEGVLRSCNNGTLEQLVGKQTKLSRCFKNVYEGRHIVDVLPQSDGLREVSTTQSDQAQSEEGSQDCRVEEASDHGTTADTHHGSPSRFSAREAGVGWKASASSTRPDVFGMQAYNRTKG